MIRYILFNRHTWTTDLKCLAMGLLVMALMLVLAIIQSELGYPGGLWLSLGVLICASAFGLWPGIIASLISLVYLVYFIELGPVRLANIMGFNLFAVFLITYERWHRLHLDTMNGNVDRLSVALKLTRDLKINWHNYREDYRLRIVEQIEDVLGNLSALIMGWLSIGKEIDRIERKVKDEQ